VLGGGDFAVGNAEVEINAGELEIFSVSIARPDIARIGREFGAPDDALTNEDSEMAEAIPDNRSDHIGQGDHASLTLFRHSRYEVLFDGSLVFR
jgi:hypothetical protein